MLPSVIELTDAAAVCCRSEEQVWNVAGSISFPHLRQS